MLRSAAALRAARKRARRVSKERNANGAWNGRRRWLASGSCSNRNVPRGPVTSSPLAILRTLPRVAQAFGS